MLFQSVLHRSDQRIAPHCGAKAVDEGTEEACVGMKNDSAGNEGWFDYKDSLFIPDDVN